MQRTQCATQMLREQEREEKKKANHRDSVCRCAAHGDYFLDRFHHLIRMAFDNCGFIIYSAINQNNRGATLFFILYLALSHSLHTLLQDFYRDLHIDVHENILSGMRFIARTKINI